MRWLVALGLLVGLLFAGDRIAEQVAERVLAGQLAGELGSRPDVEIAGVLFLPQVVQGRYDAIEVSAGNLVRSGIPLQSFTATLTGAELPLGDALRRSVTAVPVRRLDATALVPYATLTEAASDGLTVGPDPEGVRISGTLQVLGRRVDVSAAAQLRLENGTVVATPRSVRAGDAEASGAVARALLGRLDLSLDLPALPYGVRLASVEPGPQGVRVTGGADDVVLRR